MMRIELTLDDELLAKARLLTGITDPERLVAAALKTLIEGDATRRLAKLGGTDLRAASPPRRRPKT